MRGVVLGLLVLAACGGAARDASVVTIANQGTPAPPPNTVAPAGPLDATLPAYAVASVVLDTALIKRAAAGLFGKTADGGASLDAARDEGELEEKLDLPKGSLLPDRILDTLGIDATRPIAAAIAPVEARERVGRLEAIAKKLGRTPTDGAHVAFGELIAAFGTEPAFTRIRVRVPVKDGAAAKRALRHFLATAGLRESGAAPGVDLLMSARRAAIAATTDGTWFVVDVYLRQGDGNAPGRDVVTSIRRLRAEGERGVDAPPLDDDGARVALLPRALAEVAFVNGVEETIGALAKAEGDARDHIAAAGLIEAHRALELAGNERGDYFSIARCAMARDGAPAPEWLRAEATFGKGFEASARVASRTPPEASLAFDHVHSFVEGSIAAGLAFPMPGDGPSGPADEGVLAGLVRDAGWSGWLIAAPLVPLYFSSIPVRSPPDAFSAKGAALKLARVAIVEPEQHRGELFVGLLRAGTSEAEAGCVLTGAVPCATHALRVDAGAVKMGSKFARVAKVGDRFVVIVGDEAPRVDALKPRVVKADRLDVDVQVPHDAFRGAASAVLFGSRTPPTLTAQGANDGERLSLTVSAH